MDSPPPQATDTAISFDQAVFLAEFGLYRINPAINQMLPSSHPHPLPTRTAPTYSKPSRIKAYDVLKDPKKRREYDMYGHGETAREAPVSTAATAGATRNSATGGWGGTPWQGVPGAGSVSGSGWVSKTAPVWLEVAILRACYCRSESGTSVIRLFVLQILGGYVV